MGAKVEFPIGQKLFHLVINPGKSRCPTVDLELVQTTRNINGTRHFVRKFQPGKRAHLFRFSTLSGNFLASPAGVFRGDRISSLGERLRGRLRIFQWDERKHVPFTAEPEIPEILTKWRAPAMLRILPPTNQTCLATNQVVASLPRRRF